MLVPLLFSEVVDLHPLAIIISVLFFGGLWGILGVFFAIPLAALMQAVLDAWPQHRGGGVGETNTEPVEQPVSKQQKSA